MSRPKSYREQDSCSNCKFCFHRSNYEYTELFCVKGLKEVPIEEGFLAPNQYGHDFNLIPLETGMNNMQNFNLIMAFEKEQSVQANGICDFWEKQ